MTMANAERFGFQRICSRSAGFRATYHKIGREMPIKTPQKGTVDINHMASSMDVPLQLSPLVIILTVTRTLDPCDLIDPSACHTNPWCEADHHRKLKKGKKTLTYSVRGVSPCSSIYEIDSCGTAHGHIGGGFFFFFSFFFPSPSPNALSVPQNLCPSNQFEISTPDGTVLGPSVIQGHPFKPSYSSPHWPSLQYVAHVLLPSAILGARATREYVSSMASI